jgi:hypothetical protein
MNVKSLKGISVDQIEECIEEKQFSTFKQVLLKCLFINEYVKINSLERNAGVLSTNSTAAGVLDFWLEWFIWATVWDITIRVT